MPQVLLKTSAGDIDIELWSKEAPKACRNFVQLSLEGNNSEPVSERSIRLLLMCLDSEPFTFIQTSSGISRHV